VKRKSPASDEPAGGKGFPDQKEITQEMTMITRQKANNHRVEYIYRRRRSQVI
jgi:hypothetical protein